MVKRIAMLFGAGFVLLIVIAAIAGSPAKQATATNAKPASPTTKAKPASAPSGPAHWDQFVEAESVQMVTTNVVNDATAKSPDATKIATDAQVAHDQIDKVRQDFALADSSGNLMAAANDLKNAMGAVVAWTNDPSAPGTTASTAARLQTAIQEWDAAATTTWPGQQSKTNISG